MVIKITDKMLLSANPVYRCRIMRLIIQGKAEYVGSWQQREGRKT
jgi:hypothetical protein